MQALLPGTSSFSGNWFAAKLRAAKQELKREARQADGHRPVRRRVLAHLRRTLAGSSFQARYHHHGTLWAATNPPPCAGSSAPPIEGYGTCRHICPTSILSSRPSPRSSTGCTGCTPHRSEPSRTLAVHRRSFRGAFSGLRESI